MEVEIRPEPSAEERRALIAALADLPQLPFSGYASAWRRAGLELEDDDSAGEAGP